MTRIKLGVMGASGKMGRAVIALVGASDAFELVSAVGADHVGRDAGESAGVGSLGVQITHDLNAMVTEGAEVVIDFSSPEGTLALAQAASKSSFAIVSGTTGLSSVCIKAMDHAAMSVPVLWEPNMSIGVHVLGELMRRAIAMLGPTFDVEIVETHHRLKVDAPSGTALKFAEIAKEEKGNRTTFVHGREGRPGARLPHEVGVMALRGGDVIGDHTVHLLGAGERLELTHRATSRELFALGALRAAGWIAKKPPGRYRLKDVVQS